ncbi:MAG: O-methyltransferase, partial [Pseudanabaena sp.]
FTEALCLILKFAIESSLHGSSHIFQPLTLFSYADGHKMLTVTGIVLENDKVEAFLEKTNIKAWNLSNINWGKPQSINVPDLTIRERLYIDALLPHTETEEIQNKLGFLFHEKEDISLEMLKTYVLFYRQSPYFSRIIM